MEHDAVHARSLAAPRSVLDAPLPRAYLNFVGRKLLALGETIQGLGAFTLISLGVALARFHTAPRVMRPLVLEQIHRAGPRLLGMMGFIAVALGFVIVGQTVSLRRVGAQDWIGTVMVMVVVRELGPLTAALLVLARVGTAIVIELGTARANGEVEALEALGIDPIHYLVVPRLIGLGVSVFALSVYLILGTIGSGYLFAFLQDVPLRPGEYFHQLASALSWRDFALLALKTTSFGIVVGVTTCYEGLAKPLQTEQLSAATTRAVVDSIVLWVLLDALFILVYLAT